MRKRQKRVLVAMGYYDYRVHRGIEKFAQEQGWHLSTDVTREKVIPWGWNGDGILAWLGAGDDLTEFVVGARKPTVDFSYRRPHLKFPRVLMDHAAAAQLVVDYFLARGFTRFLYYNDIENWSFEERGRGFMAALRQAGKSGCWLRWSQSPAYHPVGRQAEERCKRKWLAAELKKIPKPVGLYAGSDGMAVDLMETCETARLAVPEQVAIVAPDNSFLSVDTMPTPLSSVDPNLEAVGYRGAALLHELMKGRPAPKEPIRVPPRELIVRRSSDLFAMSHPGIARGLRFLWEHCHEPIGVEDMAKVAGMSLRGFYHAFLENIGRSPGSELQRLRIERAKKLLAASSEKMQTIAATCGYQSANSFWVAFKQATGMSPGQYRLKVKSVSVD
jgi:LacI family transcriptional regulator